MGLVDWCYPPRCAACDLGMRRAAPLCDGCAVSLYPLGVACLRCAEPHDGPLAVLCRRCRRQPLPLERLTAPWRYGGELATALRRLKFDGRSDLARQLGPLYRGPLAAAAAAVDVVVPVPLHWSRRLRRGYDQAALLAGAAGPLPVPIEPALLRRRRRTPPQTGHGAIARWQNLHGAFAVPRPARVDGRRVLLVDDVATTGATLAAAATALLRAGAAEVHGFAIARAESPRG